MSAELDPGGPFGQDPLREEPFRDDEPDDDPLARTLQLRRNSLLHTVFLQSTGLRAGWRAALYAALFILIFFIVQATGSFIGSRMIIAPGGQLTPAALFRQEFALAFSAIAAALVMGALEDRPFGAYGLPLRGAFGRNFWQGVLWGLGQVTALMVSIWAFGGFSFGGIAMPGAQLARYAIVWGSFFLLVGIAEEFMFRGYLQFTLGGAMGFWPTATLLSAGFGAVHLANPGEGPVGALGVFAIGMLFCLTLRRTGSLWFAVGMHAAFDFGETYLYAVPDSGLVMPGHLFASSLHGARWLTGGTVGPEGSVLSFVLVAVTFAALSLVYRAPKPAADGITAQP